MCVIEILYMVKKHVRRAIRWHCENLFLKIEVLFPVFQSSSNIEFCWIWWVMALLIRPYQLLAILGFILSGHGALLTFSKFIIFLNFFRSNFNTFNFNNFSWSWKILFTCGMFTVSYRWKFSDICTLSDIKFPI